MRGPAASCTCSSLLPVSSPNSFVGDLSCSVTQHLRPQHYERGPHVSPQSLRRRFGIRLRGPADDRPLPAAEASQPQRGLTYARLQRRPGSDPRPQCVEHIQAAATPRGRGITEGFQPGATGGDGPVIAQHAWRRLQPRDDIFRLFVPSPWALSSFLPGSSRGPSAYWWASWVCYLTLSTAQLLSPPVAAMLFPRSSCRDSSASYRLQYG